MASSTNGATGRVVPPFLTTPIRFDIFSRTLSDVFGSADEDDAPAEPREKIEKVEKIEKIQPVVPTLYPAAPAPQPPQPVAPALRFDPRTKSLLLLLCDHPADAPAGNAELGQALLGCEEAPMTPQLLARYRAVVQRLTLVARMIDAVEGDPVVPDGFKQVFDRLRFTLIKAVLADSNFLVQRSHPLRAIAADLALRAATSRQWDVTIEREFATALDNAVRDFDLSASFVRPMLSRLQPLNLEVIKEFMQQLQAERNERGHAVRAQQQVDNEIALRLQGAVLDPKLRFVIEEEWKAVLLWQILTFGRESAEWRAGLTVAEDLLRQAPGIQAGAEVPTSLLKRLKSGLEDAGRQPEQALAALEVLRKAKPAAPTAAAEFARIATRTAPLSRLMEGFRWFRVFDHGAQKMRWMKTSSFDPSKNTVSFIEIDGGSPLEMHVSQFLDDLRRGLSAPNNPDTETAELVSALRAEAA